MLGQTILRAGGSEIVLNLDASRLRVIHPSKATILAAEGEVNEQAWREH